MREDSLTKVIQVWGKRMRQMYSIRIRKELKGFAKENRNAMEAG